jgi:F-type H+-transporting ATPase subunit beta
MFRIAKCDEVDHHPVGEIAEVHGPVAVIACDTLPPLRQALCARLDHDACLFEVHQHLDERHVRAITLHGSAGLHRGMTVYDTGAPLHVPVMPECLGRLLDIFGDPLDAGDPLPAGEFRNVHGRPVPLHEVYCPRR